MQQQIDHRRSYRLCGFGSRILNVAGFLLLSLVFPARAKAQWEEVYRIKAEADQIEMDILFNVYAIKGAEIHKYNRNGSLEFQYSDMQLGHIGRADVTFPLSILLLYDELNYVAVLDNTLSAKRKNLNLLNLGVGMCTAAASSVQNHVWLYDAMTFSLYRYNENLQKVVETGNLSQILGVDLNFGQMTEFANRLYINNSATGILVFDIFGTFMHTIPVKGAEKFQVDDSGIYAFSKGKLGRYDFREQEYNTLELPLSCTEAVAQKNHVALLNKGEIIVYRILP